MKNKYIINISLSALFLAVGLALPFLTGQIQYVGNMLLPMHIPVILCGLICSWQYGFAVGFILPLLRSFLFGMPVMYPSAVAMAFELATYGAVVGFLYNKNRWKCIHSLYRSMLTAMVAGRVVWGAVSALLMTASGGAFTFKMFLAGAFTTAIPGIILQLVAVPGIMVALDRTKLVPFSKTKKRGHCHAECTDRKN